MTTTVILTGTGVPLPAPGPVATRASRRWGAI